MSQSDSQPQDPWETPPTEVDAEQVAVSQQLMAKFAPENAENSVAAVPDEKDLLIAKLTQEKEWLFKRNVNLVAEISQLRALNHQLLSQISDLNQTSSNQNWFTRFWKQFQ